MEGRNTLQKELIYRALCAMDNHPTAAMVYDQVHRDHPAVSRSTVYRVLARMAEEGKSCAWSWAAATAATTGPSAPTDMSGAGSAAR